ncbi:hypothetical protein ASPWEDRAFT_40642 [Aspergillus wentii DTO 134E9]|uniref:NADH dehydrogenase [ubiquinone] 1 alpha subcomplex assembly factor 3 n=1 Tax=Aspergillus wentii DTO 134E9 TaxID=1073089 RepID=A0A1L9RKL1_ASPWE|nr:uncharacterized protein ASPWEDRAFT_40642 [Aspergillus wentii DTO 134E9]KAI9924788.1 hypothetical protein MW887_006644 [Aspergillus wentii]OJJ35444.1 hypothetical protein ASPWEDRAFT_40642 [Aspergillus wentii DTO 134E9]
MHTPSPQLLRALRTSISTTSTATLRGSLRTSTPISRITSPCAAISNTLPSRRHNTTSVSRPTRMIPRSHSAKPTSHDRGPTSNESTQTDFAALNVLGSVPPPTTAIEATLDDGFHLDNGLRVEGGDGLLLVGGEAFAWRPWEVTAGGKMGMVNKKGQFEVDEQVWGLLNAVWPRPDLLVIGMGATMVPLSPDTKRHINSLGVRVEVLDTRNAAAQFNLLATERGVSEVAAAMIPIGFKGR